MCLCVCERASFWPYNAMSFEPMSEGRSPFRLLLPRYLRSREKSKHSENVYMCAFFGEEIKKWLNLQILQWSKLFEWSRYLARQLVEAQVPVVVRSLHPNTHTCVHTHFKLVMGNTHKNVRLGKVLSCSGIRPRIWQFLNDLHFQV